ncbi:hypothetical protein OH77DRAFT_621952 [Trametes cingulata]|nr:hypothetical protein OH77DRAFT_621952 [Trametes cingulata]
MKLNSRERLTAKPSRDPLPTHLLARTTEHGPPHRTSTSTPRLPRHPQAQITHSQGFQARQSP